MNANDRENVSVSVNVSENENVDHRVNDHVNHSHASDRENVSLFR